MYNKRVYFSNLLFEVCRMRMPTYKTLAGFLIPQLFCCVIINAQGGLITDVSGKPIYLKVEYTIEGSPFYPKDYYRASIYTREGKVYEEINVRFNVMDNLLLMKQDDGTELVVTSPVSRVIFTDRDPPGMLNSVFAKGFPRTGQQNEQTYYEMLDSGRVKLLKHRSASYDDKTYYGLAGITRVFEIKVTYYLFAEGKMGKLDKGKDELLSLITEKKEELNKYIDEKSLKCRNESDWKNVIAYYNSLFKTP